MTEQVSPHIYEGQQHTQASSQCTYGTGQNGSGDDVKSPQNSSFSRNSSKELTSGIEKDSQEPTAETATADCKKIDKSLIQQILDDIIKEAWDILRSKESPALQKMNCDEQKPDSLNNGMKISKNIEQCSPCSLVPSLEESRAEQPGKEMTPQCLGPDLESQHRLLFLHIQLRIAKDFKIFFNLLKATKASSKEESVFSVISSQSSLKTEKIMQWKCSGETAGLEVTLRGLFSIREFTDFLKRDFFPSELVQAIPLWCNFKAIYELCDEEKSLTKQLEVFVKLMKVENEPPNQCIIQLFDEFKKLAELENSMDRNALVSVKDKKNYSETLDKMFSVLVKTRTSLFPRYEKWANNHILDISLESSHAGQRKLQSPEISALSPNEINLESQLRQMQPDTRAPPCFLQLWQSHHALLFSLGSALIIHIHEKEDIKRQNNLVCVPKLLDFKKFGINEKYIYKLRVIVHLQPTEQMNSFMVQMIDDSEETSEMLAQGCYAYLLFFEQELRQLADDKDKPFVSYPILEMKPKIMPKVQREQTPANQIQRSYQTDISKGKKLEFSSGLPNLGNTCFMNAALNGLYSLHSFRAYCSTQKEQGPLLLALFQFCIMYTAKEVPSNILYRFKRAIAEFSDGRQHCANSYTFKLLMLLDTLIPCKSETYLPPNIFGNKLRQYRRGKCEPLHDIFSALVENLFICTECSNTRRNFSYFRTVDVPIPYQAETVEDMTLFSENNFYPEKCATEYNGTETSEITYITGFKEKIQKFLPFASPKPLIRTELLQCFKYMLRASLMSPQSLMQCDSCGFPTQHYKQSFFRQLSTCFVIHFKRFDERTGRKINTPIEFPMNLDMSDYCVNDPRKYVLRGVIYHLGSWSSGHYTARICVRDHWFAVSDLYVREEQNRPPSENAYMLFYEETAVDGA